MTPVDIIGLNYEYTSMDYLLFYLLEKLVSYASFAVASLLLVSIKQYLHEVYSFFYIPKPASYVMTVGFIYWFMLYVIGLYSYIAKLKKSKSKAQLKSLAMGRTCQLLTILILILCGGDTTDQLWGMVKASALNGGDFIQPATPFQMGDLDDFVSHSFLNLFVLSLFPIGKYMVQFLLRYTASHFGRRTGQVDAYDYRLTLNPHSIMFDMMMIITVGISSTCFSYVFWLATAALVFVYMILLNLSMFKFGVFKKSMGLENESLVVRSV